MLLDCNLIKYSFVNGDSVFILIEFVDPLNC